MRAKPCLLHTSQLEIEMTEAEKWREKAGLWSALALTSGDLVIFRALNHLAADATNLADELDAEDYARITLH
jgi:hypothetical protein